MEFKDIPKILFDEFSERYGYSETKTIDGELRGEKVDCRKLKLDIPGIRKSNCWIGLNEDPEQHRYEFSIWDEEPNYMASHIFYAWQSDCSPIVFSIKGKSRDTAICYRPQPLVPDSPATYFLARLLTRGLELSAEVSAAQGIVHTILK